uniref:Uncharacterized protein n=1 Tax=Anguilla anguilla TaxID=7936 RepID=A0A0E9XGW2_ANGAN
MNNPQTRDRGCSYDVQNAPRTRRLN